MLTRRSRDGKAAEGRSGLRTPPSAAPAQRQPPQERPSVIATLAIWLLVVVMIVPEGFTYGPSATRIPTEGSAVSRTVWLVLLAFGVIVPLSRSRVALKLFRQINPFLLLFVALAAASVLWSIDPAVTIRRMVRVSTMVLDAIAFAMLGWHARRFQEVMRPILTLLLVGSVIFVIAAPQLAIEQASASELLGAWHGLATQKNGLGSLSAITLILWLHGLLTKEKASWLAASGVALSALCLYQSRSSSSIMGASFAVVLMVMLLRPPSGLRRYLPYLIVLFVATLLLYSLAVLNVIPGSHLLLSPISSLTGKDLTFSGRTAIWAVMNDHIALRPFLGSGFGAYWVQSPSSPSMEMERRLYFYPTEAHNGYLDVINDLGYIGVICLIGYLLTYLRQGMRLFASMRPQGVLYLILLFEQLVANLTESRWFNVLCCEFVIMTIATVALGRALMDQRDTSARKSSPARNAPPRNAPPRRGPPSVIGRRRF